MMKYLILCTALMISCINFTGQKNEQNIKGSFNSFFYKYRNDTTFQMTHTVFPVQHFSFSDDYNPKVIKKKIEKKDWFCLKLTDSKTYDLSVDSISSIDTVKVVLSGIDTGVYVTYYFHNSDGLWKLVKVFDESN